MIRCASMGSIRRPSDSGSKSTEATAFIKCFDGREPQIHELWCLGLDGIIRKVCPTALVEVTTGTVGDFLTDYLAENGRRIHTIGKLSVNVSVQFLGMPDQDGRSWLLFICNILDRFEATGLGSGNYLNQEW